MFTDEGHLVGHPVDGQDSVGPLITGLDEELLRGCVPGRETQGRCWLAWRVPQLFAIQTFDSSRLI